MLFRCSLQNYRVDILDAARQFGASSQGLVQFFQFLVNRGCFFEIKILAGLFAILFVGSAKPSPAGIQERHQPLHLRVVFFFLHPAKHGARHIFISE